MSRVWCHASVFVHFSCWAISGLSSLQFAAGHVPTQGHIAIYDTSSPQSWHVVNLKRYWQPRMLLGRICAVTIGIYLIHGQNCFARSPSKGTLQVNYTWERSSCFSLYFCFILSLCWSLSSFLLRDASITIPDAIIFDMIMRQVVVRRHSCYHHAHSH